MLMIFKKLVGHLQFNYSKYFILLAIDKIINIIYTIYIVKLLTEFEYGIYGFTISFSSYASNILLLGIGTPIVVIIGKSEFLKKNIESIIVKLFSFSLILYLGLAFFIYFYSNSLSEIFYDDSKNKIYLIVLLLIILLDTIVAYKSISFRLLDDFVDNASFLLKSNSIKILVFIFVILISKNFFYAFFSSAICTLIFVLLSDGFFKKIKNNIVFSVDFKIFKNEILIIKEGIPFLFIYFLMNFSLYLINFLIVNKLSLENYATYNFNFTLAFLPMSFISYIVFYSFPKYVSNSYSKNLNKQLILDLTLGLFFILIYYVLTFFIYNYLLDLVGKSSYSNFSLFSIIYFSMVMTAIINFLYFPLLNDKRYLRIICIICISILVNIAYLLINDVFKIHTPSIGLILSQLTIFILFLISINEKKVSIHRSSK